MLFNRVRQWFRIGNTGTAAGRALLGEQFRILTSQIPLLYGVLMIDSASIAYVVPGALVPWGLRFGVPGALLVVSAVRLLQWLRKRATRPDADVALAQLRRTRLLAGLLNAGFSLWALALFETVDAAAKAPLALLVFMGSVASAYCLASLPSAARLTLLLSALPISLRLLTTGEPLLVCIGFDLLLMLLLLVHIMNGNFRDLVQLVASRAKITAERERARRAQAHARAAQAKAERAERAARSAHATLLDALDVVPEGLAVLDKDDRYVLWNRRYAELYGQSESALAVGMRFEDMLRAGLARGQYPEAKGREEEWLAERLACHAQPQSKHEQQLPGERWIRVEERRTADGGSIGVRVDITELKQREASFRLLFEENPLPMWVVDVNTLELLAVNAATCRHYGYSREQLLTMTILDLRVPEEAGQLRAEFRGHRGMQTEREPRRHVTADGRIIEVAIEARPLRYNGRDACVAAAFDLTDRKRAERRIMHLACHDPLTDLPNRAAMDQRLAQTLDRAGGDGGFAVLCIDLDRFKEINDLYGHSTGDAVLREVSRRLSAAAQGAFLARIGGDEFVAIVEEGPLPASAELLASKLQQALAAEVEVEGHLLPFGISIGIAVYPRDGDDARMLLVNADAALYRAKHDGRGAIRFFTPAMDQQLRDRRALERDLRAAIGNNELSLAFQPQRQRDGRIIGFEALARWRHPTRGNVPPGEFIPIAEESDLIVAIGEWGLRAACTEAASWPSPLRIAVNVSAVQFRRGNLLQTVRDVLAETGLDPTRLELEITEGVLVENFARATMVLKGLKSMGVHIALDDFGTGYSSLSYLQSFPLDRIKIDRTFVANLGRADRSLAIVRAVIGLAHGLSLPVLAEGVETHEQLEILTREGCDEVQGYLVGHPRPIAVYADIVYGARGTMATGSA